MANKVQGNRNSKFKTANRNINTRNGIKKKVLKTKVQDARQKIIQKKRTTVVDARDVLAKMAKTKDARSKLNRLRETRGGRTATNPNVKVIGHNIVQKIDRNGKISLSTNKGKGDINIAIRKQLGLVTQTRPQTKKVNVKRIVANSPQKRNNPTNIRKTVLNSLDLAPLDARIERMERLYKANVYKWTNPEIIRPASQMISSLEARHAVPRSTLLPETWPGYVHKKPLRLAPSPGYIDLDSIDDDEEMPLVAPIRHTIGLQGPSRVSNIHSRLDGMHPETHGILSHATAKVVLPAGHRIVVSNLQSTVTQDDIKELFEDIGQLLAARLVRPGVAEVIYKNLKDAQKAVDTYHNRQLDGQPMKCLLVNKRPLNHPTAPALTKTDSPGIIAARKTALANTNKLVPDINTIHKVLFQRK